MHDHLRRPVPSSLLHLARRLPGLWHHRARGRPHLLPRALLVSRPRLPLAAADSATAGSTAVVVAVPQLHLRVAHHQYLIRPSRIHGLQGSEELYGCMPGTEAVMLAA